MMQPAADDQKRLRLGKPIHTVCAPYKTHSSLGRLLDFHLLVLSLLNLPKQIPPLTQLNREQASNKLARDDFLWRRPSVVFYLQ